MNQWCYFTKPTVLGAKGNPVTTLQLHGRAQVTKYGGGLCFSFHFNALSSNCYISAVRWNTSWICEMPFEHQILLNCIWLHHSAWEY